MHPDARQLRPDVIRAGSFESWELTASEDGLKLGVGLVLRQYDCLYWTVLQRTGQDLVFLAAEEIAHPGWPNVELRAPGLWAEIGINQPGEHLSLDLKGFGLEIDDPADLVGEPVGRRLRMRFDIEWHCRATSIEPGRFVGNGAVEGDLLLGEDWSELSGDAVGQWVHRYGDGAWPGPDGGGSIPYLAKRLGAGRPAG